MYLCYLLYNNDNKTYIGSTNDFKRRLRQHNGELVGGAKYTTAFKGEHGWSPIVKVEGFTDRCVALSFEWRMKKRRNNQNKLKPAKGLSARIINIFEIITEDQITQKSCKVSELEDLTIKIKEEYYTKNKDTIDKHLENKVNIKIEIF